jgi:hypothetical protein
VPYRCPLGRYHVCRRISIACHGLCLHLRVLRVWLRHAMSRVIRCWDGMRRSGCCSNSESYYDCRSTVTFESLRLKWGRSRCATRECSGRQLPSGRCACYASLQVLYHSISLSICLPCTEHRLSSCSACDLASVTPPITISLWFSHVLDPDARIYSAL